MSWIVRKRSDGSPSLRPDNVRKRGQHMEARSRAHSRRDSSGICSQIGVAEGREAGINQLVSGLQTPAAPYRRVQADVLTD